MTLVELARQLRPTIEQAVSAALDDAQALKSVPLFPAWTPDRAVQQGERYRYNGVLYRVVQPHTTQTGWEPDKTPALWVTVSLEEWPAFVQPTGTHDAYNTGDKVTFNGAHYICLVDNCTWSPEAYPEGWEKQEGEIS